MKTVSFFSNVKKFTEIFKVFIFLSLMLHSTLSVNQNIIYEKIYGRVNRGQFAYDVIETSDGNFFVCGVSAINSPWGFDGYILKINQNGDTLWTKTLFASQNNNSNDYLLSIVPKNNNYVFAGHGYIEPLKKIDAWLIEMDVNGTIIQQKKFGGSEVDEVNKIITFPTGGFMAIGSTQSYGTQTGGKDLWLIRLNNNLDTIWTKTIDLGYIDEGTSIIPFQNDKFLIIANSCTNNCNSVGGFFIETRCYTLLIDSTGNVLSTKTYSSGKKNMFRSIYPTTDGGAVIAGVINTAAMQPNTYFWVVKIDQNTDTLWTKRYGLANRYNGGKSIIQLSDGTYIVAGYTQSYIDQIYTDFDDPWILKLDSQGDTLWSVHRGGLENDGILKIIQSADGSLVFTGYYDLPSDTLVIMVPSKVYFGKLTDTLYNTLSKIPSYQEIHVYPNPFSEKLTIQTNQYLSNATLIIENILGQNVTQINNISGQSITIQRNNLPEGLFFIRLINNHNEIAAKKVIISN